ncbi:MAG: phenylalanine--tRNA ligase subunit beta [Gemmatimonadales bacterium]
MNVSMMWLEAMLGRSLDVRETAERLTMLGAAVDAVEPLFQGLDDVIVGLVESVKKHPDADRLSLCQVRAGGEAVEVVCGAPNVLAGVRYAYAPIGATLPGGLTLTKRKIRGVVSNGMLCSARELGLGHDHEGIMPVPGDVAPGTRLVEAMSLTDTRLVVDVTPNRPDLLGHKGIARDLGAVLGARVKLPVVPGATAAAQTPRRVEREGTVDGIRVAIEDVAGCPRYVAAVIRGVTIGPSPAWLQARLRAIGARPINNVVDATNYLLHELGQPTHAFDLRHLRGGAVIVRAARAGERLTTLDGADRALSPGMTLICDAQGPVGVGGVMGGANSEVRPDTTDILLECAAFDPRRIRTTRTALKLSTDASYRFERGVDVIGLPGALRRGVELILAVAGGREVEAAIDVCPTMPAPTTVFLRPARVERLLGVPVPVAELEDLLTRIGFTVVPKEDRLAVQVPGWRPDVTREVDLIEEVARLRGYDQFPVEMRPFRPTTVPADPLEVLKGGLRTMLTGFGLFEARSLPFDAGGPDAQAVRNPLSQEEGFLRVALTPGLVRAIERNWAVRERDIRLFEIGTVFRAGHPVPSETVRVAGVLTGARHPAHWSGKAGDYDQWDVRAMLEAVVGVAGAPDASVTPDGSGWVVRDAAGSEWGRAGIVAADAPRGAGVVVGFELDLDATPRPPARDQPLPVTPVVERDVALVLPAGRTAAEVEGVLRQAAGPLLESVTIFDEFQGAGMAGRSVAWRLVFRDPARTLTDADVDAVITAVLTALKEQLDVRRREA